MKMSGSLEKTIPVVIPAVRPIKDFLFTFSACAYRVIFDIAVDHQYLLFLTG